MQQQLMRIAGELAELPASPNHPATPHVKAATRSILLALGVCGALGDPADPSATGPEGAPGEPPASPRGPAGPGEAQGELKEALGSPGEAQGGSGEAQGSSGEAREGSVNPGEAQGGSLGVRETAHQGRDQDRLGAPHAAGARPTQTQDAPANIPAAVSALSGHFRGHAAPHVLQAPEPAAPDWRPPLRDLVGRLTAAAQLPAHSEAAVLQACVDDRAWWDLLPAGQQVALTSYFSTRIRHLQDADASINLDRSVRQLTARQAAHNPGHVHGLARAHVPRAGLSWEGEARVNLGALSRASAPPLHPSKETKKKEKKVRSSDDGERIEPEALPADWPWRPYLAGKRAVIVGGDERPVARDRLLAYFGLHSLEWVRVQSGRTRELQALAQRVKGGTVDLVFALARFSGHNLDNIVQDPCKSENVPFVVLQSGYGLEGVRLAVERFIAVDGGSNSD